MILLTARKVLNRSVPAQVSRGLPARLWILFARQGAVFTPQQLEAVAICRCGRGFVL